jgi:hypothetical protein
VRVFRVRGLECQAARDTFAKLTDDACAGAAPYGCRCENTPEYKWQEGVAVGQLGNGQQQLGYALEPTEVAPLY